jgi:hypothetical protein
MIKEYDLTIFPRMFWIILNPTYDEVKDRFLIYNSNQDGYDTFRVSDYNECIDRADGNVTRVSDAKTNNQGYLIFIFGEYKADNDLPKLVELITHESGHVSDFLQEDIGIKSPDTEVNSYISGYVAGKIMEAILENKNKTNKQ